MPAVAAVSPSSFLSSLVCSVYNPDACLKWHTDWSWDRTVEHYSRWIVWGLSVRKHMNVFYIWALLKTNSSFCGIMWIRGGRKLAVIMYIVCMKPLRSPCFSKLAVPLQFNLKSSARGLGVWGFCSVSLLTLGLHSSKQTSDLLLTFGTTITLTLNNFFISSFSFWYFFIFSCFFLIFQSLGIT